MGVCRVLDGVGRTVYFDVGGEREGGKNGFAGV